MKNRDIYLKDPGENRLVNQGVAEVADPGSEQELRTLRYELETFVCEGQYARGLERILGAYLAHIDREEQPGVWVSGFYGSGKSHLVKMLRFLWADYKFPDGATARGLVHLPSEIQAQLVELSNLGKRLGGLHAAGGKLGSGADTIRLALLGIVHQSLGLPTDYAAARFVLHLRKNGYLDAVRAAVEKAGRRWEAELQDLYVSPVLARAVLDADPTFAPAEKEVRSQIKANFPRPTEISDTDLVLALEAALAPAGKFPATLIVLDEVQQFIGENTDRAYKVQEMAEACAKRFGARISFVGTGQTAITGTPNLARLQARFRLPIELSDSDVDTVVRKIVLAKKPDKEPQVRALLDSCSGEISRHLSGTKLSPRPEDQQVIVADYPLLPVRRRFWEQALRAVDPTGMKAELRNQLTNVFEAVAATADQPVGHVVAADFLYDQNKTQMVATGVLLREIQEVIEKLDDGTAAGRLKARLCALCFLIGKLPREMGSDSGVRATPGVLADMLVEDLSAGSASLRQQVPGLLEELAASGTLMAVGGEYRLQTREGAAWEQEYRNRLARIQNDETMLANERAELLRAGVGAALKTIKLLHGQSKEQRKLQPHFALDAPSAAGGDLDVWVRDGWNVEEASVLADARAAGTQSPLVTLFLPRVGAEDLKKWIASAKAARETLNAKGHPGTAEGQEARVAMETRARQAELQRDQHLADIQAKARVFLGGGSEKTGASLVDKVKDAAEDALLRLYPKFGDADDARWGKVVERARQGAGDALDAVGYNGNPEQHRVCQALSTFVSGGRKGKDVRKQFAAPPYGWPQDAIDGGLMVLVGSGQLRATLDGKAVTQKQLDQKNLAQADFRPESATVTLPQRMQLRKLFQDLGVPCSPNEEAAAAAPFLMALKSLALSAGGEAPRPAVPAPPRIDEWARLAGNEQLVAICAAATEVGQWIADWRQRAQSIEKRWPRWGMLERLQEHARRLPIAADVAPQIEALRANRALLSEPDPVPPLVAGLAQALRQALREAHARYVATHERESAALAAIDDWKRLTPDQQAGILSSLGLSGVPSIAVATEQELLDSLAARSLENWEILVEALPERFFKAEEEAHRLLQPTARRVELPSTTIHDEAELKRWLDTVAERVRKQLASGPVIL